MPRPKPYDWQREARLATPRQFFIGAMVALTVIGAFCLAGWIAQILFP